MTRKPIFDAVRAMLGPLKQHAPTNKSARDLTRFYSPSDSLRTGHTDHGSKLSGTQFLTIMDDDFRVSPVEALDGSSGPSAVFRAVWTIIVYSIQCVVRARTRAHVFEECIKIIRPPIAYGYASRPIINEALVAGVEASSLYPAPASVLRSFSIRFREIVLGPVNSQATATFCPTGPKPNALHNDQRAAFAATQPMRLAPPRLRLTDNCKAPRFMTYHLYFCHSV